MDPWQKESLNLQVGDFIIWQDEAVEGEGHPAVVSCAISKVKLVTVLDQQCPLERIEALARSFIALIVDHKQTGP